LIAQNYVQSKADLKGWNGEQWICIRDLIDKESKWKSDADNPNSSAYGLFQMLKTPTDLNIEEQTERGLRYIEHRYDTPCKAWRHHQRKNWY